MNIAIVIPAYNEARTLRDIVVRALRQSGNVIVVDDGSGDDTSAAVRDLPAVLIRHEQNQGKGAALCTGFQRALSLGVDAVVTMDGDGQHRPEDVARLVAAARTRPHGLIIAARLCERERMPRSRYYGNRLADVSVGWAAGHAIVDSQSGQRLYPAALVAALSPPSGEAMRYALESEIVIQAARLGYTCVAVPIETIYDATARPSHFRPMHDTVAIASVIWGHLEEIRFDPRALWRAFFGRPCIVEADPSRSSIATSAGTFRQPGS